jgi:hypothetical protein
MKDYDILCHVISYRYRVMPSGKPPESEVLEHDDRVAGGELVEQRIEALERIGKSIVPASGGNESGLKTPMS